MGTFLPIIVIAVIAYLIFSPKNEEKQKNDNGENKETTIYHVTKKGDDASTGFSRAFGETLGTAFGTVVVIIVIIAVVLFSAYSCISGSVR